MCAIDALGIPYLVHEASEIDATEPGSDRQITVSIDLDATTPRWTPEDAVVVAASSGPGCTARCACPQINVFASTAAAERYLARAELRGLILTVPDATQAGRHVFGDVLERLAETSER